MNDLASFRDRSPGLLATTILGPDGEVESSEGPDTIAEVIAPLGTALLSVAERATAELGRGTLQRVVLEAPQGTVAATALSGGRTLLVVADASLPLGMVLDDVAALSSGEVSHG